MTIPDRISVYVCPGCGQWTCYRRKRCAWCDDPRPLLVVSYIPEGERR